MDNRLKMYLQPIYLQHANTLRFTLCSITHSWLLFTVPDEPAYLGCFRDILPRHLQVYIPTRPATIGSCVDTCKSQGFSIAALRNSDLCFCGNSYSKSYQVTEKECDMPCYDNSYEVCGGFMTFSQYWTGENYHSTIKLRPGGTFYNGLYTGRFKNSRKSLCIQNF